MTRLFSSKNILRDLNQNSLLSPKLQIINADAFTWLKSNQDLYDIVVLDFPDPSNYSLSKLFTTSFFKILRDRLSSEGAISIQCTSPLVARKSYWCINETLKSVGFITTPYHAYVPSFGEWGFIIATHQPFHIIKPFCPNLRFVSEKSFPPMLQFTEDMSPVPVKINTLNNHHLVQYFESEWSEYSH
jgi:spermidine synthase